MGIAMGFSIFIRFALTGDNLINPSKNGPLVLCALQFARKKLPLAGNEEREDEHNLALNFAPD